MNSPISLKLSRLNLLTDADRKAIDRLTQIQTMIPAGTDISSFDDNITNVRFLLSGYACRQGSLMDGRRLIVSLVMPGDEMVPHVPSAYLPDYCAVALTDVMISSIAVEKAEAMMQEYPAVAVAMKIAGQVTISTLHERIMSLGMRTAKERMAQLFCEVFLRNKMVGLVSGTKCPLPFTQAHIAEMLGMSLVHVNRSLQSLRGDRLVNFGLGTLQVLDFEALEELAHFNSSYLTLPRARKTRTSEADLMANDM